MQEASQRLRYTYTLSSAEQREDQSGYRMKASERGTHQLSMAEGGINQDAEKSQPARGTHLLFKLSAEGGTR